MDSAERNFGDKDGQICPICREIVGAGSEASRLLGFALFNLNKANYRATETLMRKAFFALTETEWDG